MGLWVKGPQMAVLIHRSTYPNYMVQAASNHMDPAQPQIGCADSTQKVNYGNSITK